MVEPVAIAQGKPLFQGLQRDIRLQLVGCRAFRSGKVLLCYALADPA